MGERNNRIGNAVFNKEINYEVLTGCGNRWTIDSAHRQRINAMNRAQALLASRRHDGVRVTREEKGKAEEVIFQKEGEKRAEKPITISPIEESSVCNKVDELSGFEARKTVGRLLRQYLDDRGLTALELLHDSSQIKMLSRMDMLYGQAVGRVASIQARMLGEDPRKRTDKLYKLVDQMTRRAGKVKDSGSHLQTIKDKGLQAALDGLGGKPSPFLIGSVLAAFIGQQRDWRKKITLILDQLDNNPGGEAFRHLDEICGEIVDGADAIRDLLGPQPDLISALRMMAQLATGAYKAGRNPGSLLARLNGAMAARPMPVTRAVLLERVERALTGTQPLTRESDAADKPAFSDLMKDLIAPGGLWGGVGISEAVVRRVRVTLKTGDDDMTPREGIEILLLQLPNQAVKIGFLLDLSRSDFGVNHQTDVLTSLLALVQSISSLEELMPRGSSKETIAAAVNDLRGRIGDDALGQEVGGLLAAKLDVLLGKKKPAAKQPPKNKEPDKPSRPAKEALGHKTFKPGEVIFSEGDVGDEAYLITSGEVGISIKSGEESILLATVGRGDIIGEMALVDDQPRMATATAASDCQLSAIPRAAFRKRLDRLAEEDGLIRHILEIFVNRLREQARNL